MGIGFDIFKANIGWNLADSVMGSISYMLCLLSRKKSRKDHSAIYQLLYSWIMNMFIP